MDDSYSTSLVVNKDWDFLKFTTFVMHNYYLFFLIFLQQKMQKMTSTPLGVFFIKPTVAFAT